MVIKYPPKPGNADQNGCIRPFNEVAQEFNKQLTDRVSRLRAQLHDAVLIYVDIYSAKYTLITEAKKHGMLWFILSSVISFDCLIKLAWDREHVWFNCRLC